MADIERDNPALAEEDLRDAFAIACLNGLAARSMMQGVEREIARLCYQMADAMLLERGPQAAPILRQPKA